VCFTASSPEYCIHKPFGAAGEGDGFTDYRVWGAIQEEQFRQTHPKQASSQCIGPVSDEGANQMIQ
jgi:hypothetical protein